MPRATSGGPAWRPPGGLALIGAMVAAFMSAQTMVSLLVPLTAAKIGASPSIIGALVSVGYVLPLLLAITVGRMVDRVGARGPLLASSAALAVAPFAVLGAIGLPALALVQVITGMAQLVFVVAAQRTVSALGRGSTGERNFGWYSTFQSGGQMLGPLLAGALLDLAGERTAFSLVTALSATATIIAVVARIGSTTASERTGAATTAPERYSARRLATNPGVRMAMVVSCAVLVIQVARQSFFPVYLEGLQYSGTVIGLAVAAMGFTSMLVRPFMATIVRVFGDRSRSLLAMLGLLTLGIGMTGFVETLPAILVATVLVGIGAGITQPLSIVTVADHVPPHVVGFALGFRLTGNRLAQIVGPIFIGLLAEAAGLRWAFVGAAGATALAAPFVLMWRGAFETAEGTLRAQAIGGTTGSAASVRSGRTP